MNSYLASEYISRRMRELGYGDHYHLRLRHLILSNHEERKVGTENHLFIAVEPFADVRIESSAGVFDQSEQLSNELSYEHRGEITLRNLSAFLAHVRLIQVIPIIQ